MTEAEFMGYLVASLASLFGFAILIGTPLFKFAKALNNLALAIELLKQVVEGIVQRLDKQDVSYDLMANKIEDLDKRFHEFQFECKAVHQYYHKHPSQNN